MAGGKCPHFHDHVVQYRDHEDHHHQANSVVPTGILHCRSNQQRQSQRDQRNCQEPAVPCESDRRSKGESAVERVGHQVREYKGYPICHECRRRERLHQGNDDPGVYCRVSHTDQAEAYEFVISRRNDHAGYLITSRTMYTGLFFDSAKILPTYSPNTPIPINWTPLANSTVIMIDA